MRNSETHKKAVNVFGLGANYDLHPEMAMLAKQGFYKDSKNMRLTNTNSNDFALERIKGEEVRYGNESESVNFTCIGVAEVNYHVVEVWVKDDDSRVVFRIDGDIMLDDSANLMGLSVSHPLQVHKNDSCNGGEFYFVDNVNPPYIYSIQDIIDKYAAGSLLYFGDFNPLLYQSFLTLPLNSPVFDSLVYMAGAGVPIGEYSYSFRFVDNDGNRTNFSPPTPLIPVVGRYNDTSSSVHYAYSDTYGGASDIAVASNYGVKIRFRVDNRLNYSYIEIGRTAWNTNQALGYVPTKQFYRMPISLSDGEFSTREFIDIKGLVWEDLTDDESTDQMGAIVTAKAIRYFNGQLVLGNVTYASRDLEDNVTFKTDNGSLWHPFIDDLGTKGYSDPYNSAYKKQYMSGERFGFGVACYDDQGNISLVVPIDDGVLNMKNVQMPNRRDRCSSRTVALSDLNWKGVPRMADIDNVDAQPVHERFYFKTSRTKTGNDTKTISSKDGDYGVLHPTRYNDSYADHAYHINTKVHDKYNLSITYSHNDDNDYNPTTFSPNIYANGLAIAGFEYDGLPDWVSAFSIVRTQPAGRVTAQGLSMYSLIDTPDRPNIGNTSFNVVDKELNAVWFLSDDISNGYASVSDAVGAEFVSPFGFFSEVYCNKYSTNPNIGLWHILDCNNTDMIVYANQYYTDPSSTTSPALNRNGAGTSAYYTKFGQWRNASVNPEFVSGTYMLFDINGIVNSSSINGGRTSDRNDYYKLTLDGNIYTQTTPQPLSAGTNPEMDVNHPSNQDWHEPWYITNIVNDGRNIIENNINEYVLTGHIQKVKSIISKGSGAAQTILLVDERWQDCMVNYYSQTKATDNVYIYIVDPNTGLEQVWLDVTYKTAADKAIIFAAIAGGGYITPEHTVKGVYTSIFDVNDRHYYIVFSPIAGVSEAYTLPAPSTEITVRYDNRFPLIVFGGDSVVGNSIFAPVDGTSDSKGDVIDGKALYAWTGFPYPAYEFNGNYKIVSDVGQISGVASYQDQEHIPINVIRQMVVSFISETRTHVPYYYCESGAGDTCVDADYNGNNAFPRVHYVMRPLKWNAANCENNFDNANEISATYKTDYPGEFIVWGKGGFRVNPRNNKDYSQWDSFNTAFSKPIVGFTERTRFCSRVAWSQKRNINEQNDPNLKSFLALNVFDISDSTQEIKFLYDNDSEKGNNLLALTGNGTCLLLTDKRIISQITGNDLMYLDADKLVSGEYWLSRTIGCSGEFWRGCAEYDNMLFFPNSESVYRLNGLKIDDILRNNQGSYFSKLHPVLEGVRSGYTDSVCAVYNVEDNEYWLHIKENNESYLNINRILNLLDSDTHGSPSAILIYSVGVGEHITTATSNSNISVLLPSSNKFNAGDYFYITGNSPIKLHLYYAGQVIETLSAGFTYLLTYQGQTSMPQWLVEMVDYVPASGATYVFNNSPTKQAWTGYLDYTADKMLNVYGNTSKDLNVLLMRDLNTYDTNVGNTINGGNVDGAVYFYVAPDSYVTKEYIDQTFNTNQSPTYCYYGANTDNNEATQLIFKNYTNGYYTQVPRKSIHPHFRIQGKYMYCAVGCDTIGDWVLTSVESGYKIIR
jgi:hypothetical protein